MSKRRLLLGLIVAAIALVIAVQPVVSAVISGDPNGKGKGSRPTGEIKRFTGILSGPGSPGDRIIPPPPYVDFICDPRAVGWHIEVIGRGPNRTRILGNPRICDHVEILMYYYSDPERDPAPPPPGYHGTAISIRKIP